MDPVWTIQSDVGDYVYIVETGECGYTGECVEFVAVVNHPLTALAVIEHAAIAKTERNRKTYSKQTFGDPELELHLNEHDDRVEVYQTRTYEDGRDVRFKEETYRIREERVRNTVHPWDRF